MPKCDNRRELEEAFVVSMFDNSKASISYRSLFVASKLLEKLILPSPDARLSEYSVARSFCCNFYVKYSSRFLPPLCIMQAPFEALAKFSICHETILLLLDIMPALALSDAL